MCDSDSASVVCVSMNASWDLELKLTHRADRALKTLAYTLCELKNENATPTTAWQYAEKQWFGLQSLRIALSHTLNVTCQLADERWFGMQSLRYTLFVKFDAAARPRVETITNSMEESMRAAAVKAFQAHFHDMNMVAKETANEQRSGLRQMSGALDKLVESLILNSEIRALVAKSKHNTFWMMLSKSSSSEITPETWAFVAKMLSARKNDWMRMMEEDSDKIREKLSSFTAIHLELSTNPRYNNQPKMPEPTKSEKWAQFATEILVLLGSVRVLACFA